MGEGVETPFPTEVVVGFWVVVDVFKVVGAGLVPITPTQTYAPSQSVEQSLPIPGL